MKSVNILGGEPPLLEIKIYKNQRKLESVFCRTELLSVKI
jgi:hypothetical protein